MQNHIPIRHRLLTPVLLCCWLVAGGLTAAMNGQNPYGTGDNSRRQKPEPPPSRAELEAEQRVSLSADKIISILRDEPGLLLQVKKMLVRKAYEQGRILDPADLTDDALFRLLRLDDNVRIIATREIEDRYYIRAKPSKEELEEQQQQMNERNLYRTGATQPSGGTASPDQVKAGLNQEEAYWLRHERDMDDYAPLAPGAVSPQPSPAAPQPAPENPQWQNPARRLNRTSLQPEDEDNYNSDLGTSLMTRVRPDDLPSLLSVAASPSASSTDTGVGDFGLGSRSRPSQSFSLGQIPSLQQTAPLDLSPDRATASAQSVPSGQPMQQASLQGYRQKIPSIADLNQDRPQIRHRPNPYADVPSLYDLYAQVAKRPPVLDRFGMDIFRNGAGNLDNLPMDLPAGPDYVLGPGDSLSIDLWGGVSQRLRRVVDREGRLSLPEVGTIPVSGRSLGEVQHLVQSALRSQFRDVDADVSLGRIRTVRVYVVGDVENPGAYDISSLSTPLNALYAAGGPTPRGSLRHLKQYRGKELVQEIDAYDLLLRGVHSEIAHLQSGDTLMVPPIGPEVTVAGMVRRPAIYELAGEKNLSEVLELAGGVLPSGTLRHIDVERLVAHEKRTMLRLDVPESNDSQAVSQALNNFDVQDGDTVRISPILPYADKTVYLDGHVFHPGKYAYQEGMKITDLIHSYNDLLPEPSRRHAEIIRLEGPDYTPKVIAFNLGQAMDGKEQDVALKPFDTIRVFGRYDFEDQPVVTVSGEVRDPGDHVTNGVTHLRDAVYLAGGLTSDAQLDDVQVFRKTDDGKLKVLSVNLQKALTGDATDDILLQPKDRVFIHRDLQKVDPATVQVQGEVARPGKYPLGEGMTTSDLVKLAGGLKRGADTQLADLSRYLEDTSTQGKRQTVEIAKAMSGDETADVPLHDGDVLTIRQVPGWNDRGAVITVQGEVNHPGTYGIREGERLSSILARAGGFRGDAYPYGAVLERAQVRDIEEKTRADLIRHVQGEGASLKLIPETDPDQKQAKDAALQQWQSALDRLQNTPPEGRLVIHISPKVNKWANTPADIQVRAGDVLTIPKAPNFVMVNGSVYNATAVTYKPGKNAAWYLQQAGGPTNIANKKGIFLIRADGSVAGGKGGLFSGGALSAEVRPGDMLVVPEKAFSGTSHWKSTLEAAQLAYAVGIAIQVARSF